METGTVMIPGTKGGIEMIGRETGQKIERDTMKRTGKRGGKREKRKEGENNTTTESTGLRGREGDRRKVEKEERIR